MKPFCEFESTTKFENLAQDTSSQVLREIIKQTRQSTADALFEKQPTNPEPG
jgi:hypothetical protein